MKRRIRTDLQSRDYHCPCGKSYLSYSALHTHIKKYHQGDQNMFEKVQTPQRVNQKRGRPTQKKPNLQSEELDELTRLETAILKIYTVLLKVIDGPILLQGNEQINPIFFQNQFTLQTTQPTQNFLEFAAEKDIKECQYILSPIINGLIKHFTMDVSIKLKLMLIIGCFELYFQSSSKQKCLNQMASCSWKNVGIDIADIVYDLMIEMLQKRGHLQCILTSNDE